MFTGIVEEVGEVVAVAELDEVVELSVRGPTVTLDASPGDSIAVNGVCLTVTAVTTDAFSAELVPETLRRTSLAEAAAGTRVNLERALTPTTRLGGHIVQGHVDGVARLVSRTPGERSDEVRFSLAAGLDRYLVDKGSVAVDGVSLTVASVQADGFAVALIPTTLATTTLSERRPGDRVNIEVDIIAKYVERLTASYLPAAQEENGDGPGDEQGDAGG